MSLLILKAGLLETIQDDGRFGFSRWGINTNGAMDRYALHVANSLVGNSITSAAVEIYYPGCEIKFIEDSLISITGADFTPSIGEIKIPLWKPVVVKKGTVLRFLRKQYGNICYLAIHGVLDLEPWLGSLSTNLKVGTGGVQGRKLLAGDIIIVKDIKYSTATFQDQSATILPWQVNAKSVYESMDEIFFVEGKEWQSLTPESQRLLTDDSWKLETSSDRMGYYITGKDSLKFQHREELVSSAVTFGTMQALPNGNIMVLMADHQTTGGYPRVGHVITAHLPKLVQITPRSELNFRKVDLATAEKMLFSLQHELTELQQACLTKLDSYYAAH
jgi:antagonist of KipI